MKFRSCSLLTALSCAVALVPAVALFPAAALAASAQPAASQQAAVSPQAAASAKPAATTLKLDSSPRMANGVPVKGQMILSATLTTAAGKGVSDESLSFYQAVDIMGGRDALLGSAKTDSTGNATLLFIPAQSGSATLKASFKGNAQLAASSVTDTEQISNATAPFTEQTSPLAAVGAWAAYGVGVLTFSVWAALFGVLLRTTIGIRRADRRTHSEPGSA